MGEPGLKLGRVAASRKRPSINVAERRGDHASAPGGAGAEVQGGARHRVTVPGCASPKSSLELQTRQDRHPPLFARPPARRR